MVTNPRSIKQIGLIQVILAASFVVWLLFFPSTGEYFAWPVTPEMTAMFLGAGFIVRTYIGYFLLRENYWYKLRWQRWGNYAFLAVILFATLWHIDEMNWIISIVVAHIWVLAYVSEPLLLPLLEPRGEAANQAHPDEQRKGPLMQGLKFWALIGLIASVGIGGIMLMNPEFMNTRWPWPLDPFNARVMAAFFALTAMWCVNVYLADDWVEADKIVLGLSIFALSQFAVWLVNLGQFDPTRKNMEVYGIGFGVFAAVFVYYYWRHFRLNRAT